ncbi:hypothetical protein [Streptomyces stelliscabiei]|uniref:Uncharacterized protein n=1 Tax=Streptomyces stelliscabiei TaxID=146820 RepID=A0A8I0NYH6_9ACTN|nr:hypothetical protein [Streptomyces stelliscabiei]KND23850.1 hypothetical protein IQ64_47620 [Streptomyces stelliscabiei]MBE1593997.1 hypothetical protein [Streptomyces stelliscabiei]MDX2521441.1 hypothetical protein [Streptomyces stelliscabiei]MDX2556183.1 hypothetical protein [Streptomyces stelliscabiei]MDX2616771.1 hypothetical protein [Streptomyces stelliscabiei]
MRGLPDQQLTAGISRYSGVEAATAQVVYDTIGNGAIVLDAAGAAVTGFDAVRPAVDRADDAPGRLQPTPGTAAL